MPRSSSRFDLSRSSRLESQLFVDEMNRGFRFRCRLASHRAEAGNVQKGNDSWRLHRDRTASAGLEPTQDPFIDSRGIAYEVADMSVIRSLRPLSVSG